MVILAREKANQHFGAIFLRGSGEFRRSAGRLKRPHQTRRQTRRQILGDPRGNPRRGNLNDFFTTTGLWMKFSLPGCAERRELPPFSHPSLGQLAGESPNTHRRVFPPQLRLGRIPFHPIRHRSGQVAPSVTHPGPGHYRAWPGSPVSGSTGQEPGAPVRPGHDMGWGRRNSTRFPQRGKRSNRSSGHACGREWTG
jgi:hypothetical protein